MRPVSAVDGVKYLLADDSWLLIRPSGTEPVLRIYAEARQPGMVEALLEHGRKSPGWRLDEGLLSLRVNYGREFASCSRLPRPCLPGSDHSPGTR